MASQPNAVVLEGDATTVAGLRFWGMGDARYTPDKDQPTGADVEREQAMQFAGDVLAEFDNDSARRESMS